MFKHIAVANDGSTTWSILVGNGDGTFQTAQSYAVDDGPSSVAVGDFNGDGHLDLAVANIVSNTVSILLGNGDGTFQTAQSYAVGLDPIAVALGDFDGFVLLHDTQTWGRPRPWRGELATGEDYLMLRFLPDGQHFLYSAVRALHLPHQTDGLAFVVVCVVPERDLLEPYVLVFQQA